MNTRFFKGFGSTTGVVVSSDFLTILVGLPSLEIQFWRMSDSIALLQTEVES